ncbi:hypothetical protein [Legionella sp. PATHC039]|nr:hypothetical protein [Legionella sp. PATHC039]MCW8396189.1 hypothetical protein [Legionella sp. PATHC039]
MKNITESRVKELSPFLILPLFSLRKKERPTPYFLTSSLFDPLFRRKFLI